MAVTLPQGASKRTAVRDMFDRIAPRYDLLNRLLTFGLDQRWRRRALDSVGVGPGDVIIDIAAGTGDLCALAAQRGASPIGIDISAGMLAVGRRRMAARDAAHAVFVQTDAERLPFADACADVATSGFALRNFVELEPVVAEAARVLRVGGRVALLDVSEPRNLLARRGHSLYFRRIVPKIGAAISDRDAYSYLPASTAYLPPPAELVELISVAGFDNVERHTFTAGTVQLITGTRRRS